MRKLWCPRRYTGSIDFNAATRQMGAQVSSETRDQLGGQLQGGQGPREMSVSLYVIRRGAPTNAGMRSGW